MARRRRLESLSIPRSVLRLVTVTARTATEGAQEVAAQVLGLTRRTAAGTQSASVAIAEDIVGVARRIAVGTRQGLREVAREAAMDRRNRSPRVQATRRRRRAGRATTS